MRKNPENHLEPKNSADNGGYQGYDVFSISKTITNATYPWTVVRKPRSYRLQGVPSTLWGIAVESMLTGRMLCLFIDFSAESIDLPQVSVRRDGNCRRDESSKYCESWNYVSTEIMNPIESGISRYECSEVKDERGCRLIYHHSGHISKFQNIFQLSSSNFYNIYYFHLFYNFHLSERRPVASLLT